jgi:dimethylhistidine N-methyltransferase
MLNKSASLRITLEPDQEFLAAVSYGLRQNPKSIPSKFFYDTIGSNLFDLICGTPEYYPTRTEINILDLFSEQISEFIGLSPILIELGSGSATKTPMLLRHLNHGARYIPIDICQSHLRQSTLRLQKMFPYIDMHPISADYTQLVSLPIDNDTDQKKVVFFPGSSIGNYTPDEAIQFLQNLAQLIGHDGALLIGVDCKKTPDHLNAAYNDSQGHTAAFNRNILHRLQRELGAQLDPDGFSHYAYYNVLLGRVEMHLMSQRKQFIQLQGELFTFDTGESLHTENSYKYSTLEFQQLAQKAGWHPKKLWTDRDDFFSVHYLTCS